MQNKANRFWVFYNDRASLAIDRERVISVLKDHGEHHFSIDVANQNTHIEVMESQPSNPSFDETLAWLNYKANDAANIEDAINAVAKDINQNIGEIWQDYKDR